jgi:hypothetical protein
MAEKRYEGPLVEGLNKRTEEVPSQSKTNKKLVLTTE